MEPTSHKTTGTANYLCEEAIFLALYIWWKMWYVNGFSVIWINFSWSKLVIYVLLWSLVIPHGVMKIGPHCFSFWLAACQQQVMSEPILIYHHDDVIKWKHFPCYWSCVRGIHRSTVNSPHKGQWRGVLMFSFTCARINGCVNNGKPGDVRRHRHHYDVIVMMNTIMRQYTEAVEWNMYICNKKEVDDVNNPWPQALKYILRTTPLICLHCNFLKRRNMFNVNMSFNQY